MSRKIKTRKIKSVIPVIIGAGITEQYYFTHIRNLTEYKFKIKPRFFGTESLSELEKKIDKVLCDEGIAICVFDADVADRDSIEMEKFKTFRLKYAENENVILCDSLPSIEYWFLIHHKDTCKHFSSNKELITELKKHIANFEKTESFLKNEKWVADLNSDDKLKTAISRAKLLGNVAKNGAFLNKKYSLY